MSPFVAQTRRPSHGQQRQLLGQDRTHLPSAVEAVHDPKRHFATAYYRIAKGLLDHLVGARKESLYPLRQTRPKLPCSRSPPWGTLLDQVV